MHMMTSKKSKESKEQEELIRAEQDLRVLGRDLEDVAEARVHKKLLKWVHEEVIPDEIEVKKESEE